jgi:hypothetical protein
MKDLNLPIIKQPDLKTKTLSMNGYFKFVQFNLKQAFDKRAYTKWKKMLIVNTPFFIK